ncbi:hypothetical protein TSUD_117940 [Trifolium subterraneum]|nr:hypothetical protein TSUD_117940 [Trifolium subterraneum]
MPQRNIVAWNCMINAYNQFERILAFAGNQTDHLALLQFKQLISSDPYGILGSWNSSTHFCKWNGVTCNLMHQRVIRLNLQEYNLHGSISPYIGNLSHMRYLNLASNLFYGNIPQELGCLSRLRFLFLANNSLAGEFPINLTKCVELKGIDLAGNNLIGKIPSQIGSLQMLQNFFMERNNLSGKIPPSIRNLASLTIFSISYNNLEGNIPKEICFLKQLKVIAVHVNKLSGTFLSCLYNMSSLNVISVAVNAFNGSLPSNMFQTLPNLQYFTIGGNQFSGPIPTSIANATSLNIFEISGNSFVGQVPSLGKLQSLWQLNMAENNLESIGECISLEYLNLQGNSFGGIIPSSLASLKGLKRLDLSRNHLSGPIPKVLQNISFLEYFNVSFNMLEGEVPIEGVFRNASDLIVTGNNNLCGGISKLHLPLCPVKRTKRAKIHNYMLIVVIVCVVVFSLLLAFILSVYWIRKRNKKQSSDSPAIDQLANVSYKDLHKGTDGFSARNLIGSGSFGSVYKGCLASDDKAVAIKVLNLQKKDAQKSFIVECNALKCIRHRNLVKILTCCSSIDYKGQEFKALVFDYMTNGSLEEWLHPKPGNVELMKILDLHQMLNIIIDVASALHYLHHECEQLVIHCDLKPSNILLDDDMVAHVSDFVIAKLVSSIDVAETSTIGIKGTIGYTPPEYGMGSKVSTCGDMYSFGILILEMLTGRRPTDEMFQDGQNMHNFVAASFPDNLMQILDTHLAARDEEAITEDGNNHRRMLTGEKIIALKWMCVSKWNKAMAVGVK